MSRMLTDHAQIRQWAEARAGSPMLMEVPNGSGGDNTILTLTFGQHAIDADGNEGPDRPVGGYRLVGWDEWLETLDRNGLALKVRDETPGALDNDFEFSPLDGRPETGPARKPAAMATERAGQGRIDRGG